MTTDLDELINSEGVVVMAVKILMRRVPKRGAWRDLNEVMRELRMLAMTQPGYISGETLLLAANQDTAMVVSTWSFINHWRDYENSPQRTALLGNLEPLLAGPATTEVWIESPVVG